MEKSIKLKLKSNASEIANAGEEISVFLKDHGLSTDTVQKQITLLCELIKIGIGYATCQASNHDITVETYIEGNSITVEIENPVDEACSDRLKELDRTIQFIRGYQDPFEAYIKMKKHVSSRSSYCGANGIDLARIASEGKATIDFYVGENNVLNLSAVSNIY
ncbi:MAG: hypothetical protein V2J25_14285 [Desulfatiglans sp.]|jgi:hypothetical protein|nr:hypothetical protein [Desulfatiglans sp.]